MFTGTVDIFHASAGTGKTHKLMDIIESYLLQGVPIEKIAFVTFTKKGAQVAQDRIHERFGIDYKRMKNIRTIHSMCFRATGAHRDVMMDFAKYRDFGNQAGFEFGNLGLNTSEGIDWSEMKDQQLVAVEQLYRNNRPYYNKVVDDKVDYQRLVLYMRLYTQYKETFGYYDFTDLLELYLEKGLYEDVEVACLDEMQDSSLLQWQVLFKAFEHTKHIYIAGDDKQAVFTWAGASFETLLSLHGNQHILAESYRVPTKILDFANNIAREIQVGNHSSCKAIHEGGEIKNITVIDELDEYFTPKESWFFLARNKKFFELFIQWCEQHGINYKVKGDPYFSQTDLLEFRQGRVQMWDKDKLAFAQACFKQGTLFIEPVVNIATIHTVKGDEADNVVLLSDISKAVSTQFDLDEDSEHRVFYVGVTRAKKRLFVVEPQTKLFYPYLF